MSNDALLVINLFPNDGLRSGDDGPPTCFSLVTLPDGSQVQITAADFLGGWQGNIPPFSNNVLKLRESVSLQQGVVYEAPAWCNNDLKDEDAHGRSILVQRNGRDIPPREDEGPLVGNRKMIRYLNVTVKVSTYKPQTQAAAVATGTADAGPGRFDLT